MSKSKVRKKKNKKKKCSGYQCPTYKGENKTIREYRDLGLFGYPYTCECKVVRTNGYIALRDIETGRTLVPCAVKSIKSPNPYMSDCGDLLCNVINSVDEDDEILLNTFCVSDVDYGPVGRTATFLQDVFSMAIWRENEGESYIQIINTMLMVKAFPALTWDKVINKSEENKN